ncbi:hypothetical protein GCM10009548_17670 [Streptomyces malaysiensis subsp. malaysiensis]
MGRRKEDGPWGDALRSDDNGHTPVEVRGREKARSPYGISGRCAEEKSAATTGRGQTAAKIDVQARHERNARCDVGRGCCLHDKYINTATLGNPKEFFDF